jgi:O-antigen/teichoic acid export membrane protein
MNQARALASRVARHAGSYGVGIVLMIVISMVNVAVFTRLMPPSEFGTLAVLLVVCGILTLVYNLAILQGTVGLTFGAGDDDAGDDLDDEAETSFVSKRETLGTGLLLTLAVALIGTLAFWVLAPQISTWLFHHEGEATGIRLAAVAGGTAALARLLITVPRFERRPWLYVALSVARPALAIAIAIPLVSAGDGADGVVAGLAAGAACVIVIALVAWRHAYHLRFNARTARAILKRGIVFVPLVMSGYLITHGGLLVLSRSVPQSDIGIYSVAATFGYVIHSCASVFFMAWLPMKRTSLFLAVHHERGAAWVHSTLVSYFVIGLGALLVGLTATAGVLVKIAGPQYRGAEDLIAVTGIAAVSHSVFLLSYRVANFPHKRAVLGATSLLAGLLFLALAIPLVDPIGTYAIPVAAGVAFAIATVAIVTFAQRGPKPIPFDRRRLAVTGIATGALVGLHTLLAPEAGALRPLLDVATVVAYPALLLAARVLTIADLRQLATVVRDALRRGVRDEDELAAAAAALPPGQARALRLAAGPDRGPADPAELVAALRSVDRIGEPGDPDAAIGRYLTSTLSRAERDGMARALWRRNVPPGDIDALEQLLAAFRRMPRAAWPAPEALEPQPFGR